MPGRAAEGDLPVAEWAVVKFAGIPGIRGILADSTTVALRLRITEA